MPSLLLLLLKRSKHELNRAECLAAVAQAHQACLTCCSCPNRPISIFVKMAPALYTLCPAYCSREAAELCNCDLVCMQVVKIPDHLKGGLNKAGRKPNKGAVRRMSSGKFALTLSEGDPLFWKAQDAGACMWQTNKVAVHCEIKPHHHFPRM